MTQPQPEAPTEAPKKISRVGALEAARDGGEAFRAGQELTDCPFVPFDDLADEYHGHHWAKGYNAAARA